MGLRGAERVPCPGNARVQRSSRDCRAWRHRYAHLHQGVPAAGAQSLSARAPARGNVRRRARQPDPARPDAVPILQRRASKTDEQVIEEAAQSDEEFLARIKREIGIDLKL